MAGRDADRAGLVAADRHVDVARGDRRGAAGRGAAGGVAALARIVHRPAGAGVAAAGHAVVFAHRLAGDLAAGVENALDDGGVDLRHIAVQEIGANRHRHAGEADIVLERDAAAGELAARLALDRGLHRPGAERVLLRRRAVRRPARIFHGRQLVRCGVERRIGSGERRDDLLDGLQILVTRIHAEPVRRLAQVGDAGFLEHDRAYFGSGTVAGLLVSETWMTRYLSGCVVEALREIACSAFGAS